MAESEGPTLSSGLCRLLIYPTGSSFTPLRARARGVAPAPHSKASASPDELGYAPRSTRPGRGVEPVRASSAPRAAREVPGTAEAGRGGTRGGAQSRPQCSRR